MKKIPKKLRLIEKAMCQFVMKRLSKQSNLNNRSINQSIKPSVIYKMKYMNKNVSMRKSLHLSSKSL